jgi:hypothetical protein
MSNLKTPLTGVNPTGIPSLTSSASRDTKTTTVGTLAAKFMTRAVQAVKTSKVQQQLFTTVLNAANKYNVSSKTSPLQTTTNQEPVDTNLANYQPAHPDGPFPDHKLFFDENIAKDPLEESSKPFESDYPSSRGEPSILKEPLLSKEEQFNYKTAGPEKLKGSHLAYKPPTLPTSLQEQ